MNQDFKKQMNFFDGLAFIFEDSPHANKMRRLCQAKLVVQDAWLEAGGCEICRGFGKLLDGRRCEHENDLGLDPMLSYGDIIHRLTNVGDAFGNIIAFPHFEVPPRQIITGDVRPYLTCRPRTLLVSGDIAEVYVTGLFFGQRGQFSASISNPIELEMFANKLWKFDVALAALDITLQLENRSDEVKKFNVALAGDVIQERQNTGRGLSWDEIEELSRGQISRDTQF